MLINDNIDIDIGLKMWFKLVLIKSSNCKKQLSELFSLKNKDGDED